jgi:hypothetical protein
MKRDTRKDSRRKVATMADRPSCGPRPNGTYKTSFSAKQRAKKAAKQLSGFTAVYQCPVCGFWHVTSAKQQKGAGPQ